jgi:outer membrane protein TolC
MAKASFARLTGGALLADEAIPDAIPAVNYDEADIARQLAGFLSQKELPTAEAVKMRKELEIQELNYANSKTRLRPKFNALVGVSQDEQSYTINVAQKYRVNSIFAGVSLYWTVFDGFAAGASQRGVLLRRRQMETDYRLLTEQLAQQAQVQAKQVNFAARSMKISDVALVTAGGNLKSKQDEFARGVIAESEVSMIQLALYDAQLNAFTSRMDYLNRIGDFLGTVAGDPVVSNVTPVK